MRKLSIIFLPIAAGAFIFVSPDAGFSQSVPGAPTGGATGASSSSATGFNSATTQAPGSTFQLQDFSRNSQLNSGRTATPAAPNSGLMRPSSPALQSSSVALPLNATELPRQSLTPNMYSTPNPVMPQQPNRSVMTSPSRLTPTYQKSQMLQQLQPGL